MSGKSIRARAPAASSPTIRLVMQAVRQRDTAPEIVLRRALHAYGLRFRKDCRPEENVKCKADVVFPRIKVCVFVDGCFWHRCPLHFQLPKTNSTWWDEKVQATVDRDARQTRLLASRGWTVIRVWEHKIVDGSFANVVARVRALVQTTK
jgi:DNA mismatch endonuclease (patch repair protein)